MLIEVHFLQRERGSKSSCDAELHEPWSQENVLRGVFLLCKVVTALDRLSPCQCVQFGKELSDVFLQGVYSLAGAPV